MIALKGRAVGVRVVCLAVVSSSREEVLIQARQHQAIRHALRALTLRLFSATLLQRGPASQQLLEIKRKEYWRVKNFRVRKNSSRGVSLGVLFGNFERVNM